VPYVHGATSPVQRRAPVLGSGHVWPLLADLAGRGLRLLFMFDQRPNLMPRYNIAPTQDVPIVRLTRDAAARELIMVRWGPVPCWADDLSIGNRLINARCETVHSARAFREAYARRRCLLPADGLFEWQKQGKLRQPFLIRRKDQVPVRLRRSVGALEKPFRRSRRARSSPARPSIGTICARRTRSKASSPPSGTAPCAPREARRTRRRSSWSSSSS
jgi:hypothetical protein